MEVNLGGIPFDLDFHPSEQLVAAGLIDGNLLLYFLFQVSILFYFVFLDHILNSIFVFAGTVIVQMLYPKGIEISSSPPSICTSCDFIKVF